MLLLGIWYLSQHLELAQTCFAGPNNCLRAISDLQFAQNVGHMITHRFLTQYEMLRDLGVFATLRDEMQNFVFAFA